MITDDKLNRICEEVLGNDMSKKEHKKDEGYTCGCQRCGRPTFLWQECIPTPRDFCSDESPRSLLMELLNEVIYSPEYDASYCPKDLIGIFIEFDSFDYFAFPARLIVEHLLKQIKKYPEEASNEQTVKT